MKKVFIMLALLLMAGATMFAEKQSWEVVEGILDGGVDSGGPYIYKFHSKHVVPNPAPYCRYEFFGKSVNLGYGEFKCKNSKKIEWVKNAESESGLLLNRNVGGSLVDTGDGIRLDLGFSSYKGSSGSYTFTGPQEVYVYQKEYKQPLEVSLPKDSYTVELGKEFGITAIVYGGSNIFVASAVCPAFMLRINLVTWKGTPRELMSEIPFTVLVIDTITNERGSASCTITVVEKTDDDEDGIGGGAGGGSPTDPGNPTDPGGSDGGGSGGGDGDGDGDPINVGDGNGDGDGDGDTGDGDGEGEGEGEGDTGDDNDPSDGGSAGTIPTDPGEEIINVGNGDVNDNDDNTGENTGGTPTDPGSDSDTGEEIIVVGDGGNSGDGTGDSDSDDSNDEIIVIGDSNTGDNNSGDSDSGGSEVIKIGSSDTIIVTDDSVTSAQNRGSNYDIAISIGLIGAGAGMGSAGTPPELGAAEAEAYQQVQQQGE